MTDHRMDPSDAVDEEQSDPEDVWSLRLYVAGRSGPSLNAIKNLERICKTHLGGRFDFKVIDLVERPELASSDQILAIPTLVRELPPPMRKIIGDLSDTKKVLVILDLEEDALE